MFIKNQSFTTVSDCILYNPHFNSWYSRWIKHLTQWIIQQSDWDIGNLDSSIHLKHPEIVIQATKNNTTELKDVNDVADDVAISGQASLAKALLSSLSTNKYFIPRDSSHHEFQ